MGLATCCSGLLGLHPHGPEGPFGSKGEKKAEHATAGAPGWAVRFHW